MKVYLDSEYICHAEPQEGFAEAEHKYFDDIAPDALTCYRFSPENGVIQCIDHSRAIIVQKSFETNEMEKALKQFGVEI